MTRTTKDFSVYVIEDDDPVLRSLCSLVKAHGHRVIPCQSAEFFLESFDPDNPACILLDLRLPGMSGMQLLKRLEEFDVVLPVVVVTAHGDIPLAVQAMRRGAIDFLEKPFEEKRLLEALEMAAGLLNNDAPPQVPNAVVAERLAKLTEREREVLDRLLLGRINKEIAEELGISQRTIEVHRSRIREKMQARGIADLMRMLG